MSLELGALALFFLGIGAWVLSLFDPRIDNANERKLDAIVLFLAAIILLLKIAATGG